MAIDDKAAYISVKLGHLAVQRDRDSYFHDLVDLCARAVDAERSTVYVVDRAKNELLARFAQRTAVEIRLPMGKGIAGTVAATGETINVPEAYADPRFDRNVDLRSGFRTQNMLAVPVWSVDGKRVIGVIQVLNKRDGTFERFDQMNLERIADGIAPALEHLAVEAP